jgi:pimeloyl-ACP methyl ester carboxylesterase
MRAQFQHEAQQKLPPMLQYLLFMSGILVALPIFVLVALAFELPITASGIGYLSGSVLVVASLILTPWARTYSRVLAISGVIVIILITSTRLILAHQEMAPAISMLTLPGGRELRWMGYLLDEQDSLIFGEALFHFIGGDSPNEHENTAFALYEAYSKMRVGQRVFPSPFVSTYLNLQKPTHFDAIVVEPEIEPSPEFAVVFLHGYMGNVTSQCWEISQAVEIFGGVTVCPSTGWRGDWWQPPGEAILRATIEYVRGRGIQRFYLAGFSNGGSGISRLAPQLKNETGLKGLIFIDGIHNGAAIRDTGLPVLIIQGAQDERMPATRARQIAEQIGASGTYVELNGDHFLIMKQPGLVQAAIARWLEQFEEKKHATTQY